MQLLDTWQLIALAAALGWASGIRLYAVLFIVGLVGYAGWFELPEHLHILSHPMVLSASGFMVAAEFFADKVPGVDLAAAEAVALYPRDSQSHRDVVRPPSTEHDQGGRCLTRS